MKRIDLNADLGESFGRWVLGDDAAMLDVVSSANIACGFHAGDPTTLLRTCELAVAAGVRIGAQVAYRDLAGFGRRFIDIASDDLTADVLYQLGGLDAMARAAGGRVDYVKPHGALYNAVADHTEQAAAVVAAIRAFDPTLPVLGLPGSALLAAADGAGLPTVGEGFADRAYTAHGRLVNRADPGAVLTDPAAVAERAVQLAAGTVRSIDGATLATAVDSLCVHGDTPGAVTLGRAVRDALRDAGWTISPFSKG